RCAGSRRLYVPLPRFADSPGDRVLSPAARAHVVCMCLSPGSLTHRGIEFCRPLRGLTSFVCASPPVRGLTGGYGSAARCEGSRRLYVPLPRFEDSPGATLCHPLRGLTSFVCASTPGTRTHRGRRFCRPLRGLTSFVCASPPVRGLTGATLCHPLRGLTSFVCASAPGSRTHRGLRFCRPLRGLGGPLRTQNSELPQAAGRNFSSS